MLRVLFFAIASSFSLSACMSIYAPPTSGKPSAVSFSFTHPNNNHVDRLVNQEKCTDKEVVGINLTSDEPHVTTVAKGKAITFSMIPVLSNEYISSTIYKIESCSQKFTLNPISDEYSFKLVIKEGGCYMIGFRLDENNKIVSANDHVTLRQCSQ